MYLPALFFILLALSVVSGLVLLSTRVPLSFIKLHILITALPPLVALLALICNKGTVMYGPWRFSSLSWVLALFVLTIGIIVQRYSIRYLAGDHSYRKYFALLTFTTAADATVWLSDDLRLLLICWGATLMGLTLLIRLNKEWQVARNAAKLSSYQFALSWFLLFITIIWLTQAAGHWQLSAILDSKSLSQLSSQEKFAINLLLMVSVVIPSAQWPFQRWLLDSVVAPTPISAVMHAGIVNAGGIMLTRFAPLFSGDSAQTILLILSGVSVLMGTGIMLVQVDYKRQLVGSTIAQMGFMLIQCSLGAYSAAIIHAVLHGLFKSTLFLQAGSAIQHQEPLERKNTPSSFLWKVSGGVIGLLTVIGYWLTSPGEGYQFISAITLGWSLSIAWTQLVASGKGPVSRIAGFSLLIGTAIVYGFIHSAFSDLLHETVKQGTQIGSSAIILLILFAVIGFLLYFAQHRSSRIIAVIYLWVIRLGEPKIKSVESHPKYLAKTLNRGGSLR